MKGRHPSDYCLISKQALGGAHFLSLEEGRIPETRYHLERDLASRGFLGRSPLFEALTVPLAVLLRAWRILRIIRREKCDEVVACTGDLIDIPSSYIASRLAGCSFFVYLFDDYVYQWVDPKTRRVARLFADVIMKRANGLIAPNEFLRDDYRDRFGVECLLIRNPGFPIVDEAIGRRHEDRSGSTIVYTGAVYHAHFDSFQRLLAALDLLQRPGTRLHLYTFQSEAQLQSAGLVGPVVLHKHLSLAEMAGVQRGADILYLPLAFNSPIPEVVRTSAPGKMGEYLGSGRPILVHAPRDSFLSWYFKDHECGLVIDEPDVDALAGGIERLLIDPQLQKALARRAFGLAKGEFSPSIARQRFFQFIEGSVEAH